jgi:predicted MFS family arabinose efflux permease
MYIRHFKRFCVFSAIGTIALLPLLVLPAMVGVLVDESAVSESFAGWSASLNFFGGALVAIAMSLRMHSLDLRSVARIGFALAAVADLASAFTATQPMAFLCARILGGVGAGAAYTAAVAAFARYDEVERGYGLFVTLQFIVSGLGLYVLPVYSPSFGTFGMFAMIAALDLVALLMAQQLPGPAVADRSRSERRSEIHVLLSAATLFALIGFGVFEAANTAQFTYVERLGVALGFPDQQIGTMLLVASLIGIPGAFVIVFIGDRFGRIGPLALGIGIAIGGLLLLAFFSDIFALYLVGGLMLGFSWAYCLPYIQGLTAALDPHGSAIAAAASASTVGGAAGPALAALVVGEGEYRSIMLLAIVLFLLALFSLWQSDRALRAGQLEFRHGTSNSRQ